MTTTPTISWPPNTCPTSPTLAHYMVDMERIDGGAVFCCKYCRDCKWIPVWDYKVFSKDIYHYGIQVAYQKLLTEHPVVVRALRKYTI